MKFNEKLKTLREEKGYTQDEIASRLNIARQSVSKWEQGINEPDFDTVKKLCVILDCTISELLDDDGEVNSSKEAKKANALKWVKCTTFILSIIGALVLVAMIFAADEQAVIHWNVDGSSKIGSKWLLLINMVAFMAIPVLVTIVTKEKKTKEYSLKHAVIYLVLNAIFMAMTLIFSAISLKIEAQKALSLVPISAIAILTAVAPFTHPKINKRNAWFGFRTNLTLSSEEAWKKINAFSSITLTAVSLAIYIIMLIFIDRDWVVYLILGLLVNIIPCIIYHEVVRNQLKKAKQK